jgi:hypothetical protein
VIVRHRDISIRGAALMTSHTVDVSEITQARRTLEDIRHFLVTINGATATQEGRSFRVDTTKYIDELTELLPPGPYKRSLD